MKKYTISIVASLFLFSSIGRAGQIYDGEPLGEAFFDLASCSIMIAHELSGSSPLQRNDVFKLHDGRLLLVSSSTSKLGSPYTITGLRITLSAKTPLTLKLPPMETIDLPIDTKKKDK